METNVSVNGDPSYLFPSQPPSYPPPRNHKWSHNYSYVVRCQFFPKQFKPVAKTNLSFQSNFNNLSPNMSQTWITYNNKQWYHCRGRRGLFTWPNQDDQTMTMTNLNNWTWPKLKLTELQRGMVFTQNNHTIELQAGPYYFQWNAIYVKDGMQNRGLGLVYRN